MKGQARPKQRTRGTMLGLIMQSLFMSSLGGGGFDHSTRGSYIYGTNPIYTPPKHTKMSYAAQNRAAKKRKNKRS